MRLITPKIVAEQRENVKAQRELFKDQKRLFVRGKSYYKSREVKLEWIDPSKRIVGDRIFTHASAPGCGEVVYEITKINSRGIWGKVIDSTVRELEPWEVC